MNRRRKRLVRVMKEEVRKLSAKLGRECQECFDRNGCNSHTNCPGCQDAGVLTREEFHGRKDRVVSGFHDKNLKWKWNPETGNNDRPVN